MHVLNTRGCSSRAKTSLRRSEDVRGSRSSFNGRCRLRCRTGPQAAGCAAGPACGRDGPALHLRADRKYCLILTNSILFLQMIYKLRKIKDPGPALPSPASSTIPPEPRHYGYEQNYFLTTLLRFFNQSPK